MAVNSIKRRSKLGHNAKLDKRYAFLEKLVLEINKIELPQSIVKKVNEEIDTVNNFGGSDREKLSKLRNAQSKILRILEKEMKIVPKNYYRNFWMAIGIAAFGIPLGVAFGTSLQNMGFIGIGIPIGLSIGLTIGIAMDKKAFNEGKQLDIDYEV